MPGGSTYQNKPEAFSNRFTKVYIYKAWFSRGLDYSPLDQGQVNWYQIENKTLSKVSKFYLEKGI